MAKSCRYWWEVSVIALIMLLVEISKKAFPPKQLASRGLYMGFKLWEKKTTTTKTRATNKQFHGSMNYWNYETVS